MNKSLWLVGLFIGFFGVFAFAKQVPAKSNRLVNDYVGLLSAGERNALEKKLVAYDDSTSTQIAIVIEESLEGDDLFDYTVRLAQEWGIGRDGKDNGLLVYVAMAERQIRIQTGYGVEGVLPDALARRIIDTQIVPAFRQKRYYDGLNRATSTVITIASGEYTNDNIDINGGIPIDLILLLIFIIIIFIIIANRNDDGDDGGYYRDGRYHGPRRRGGGTIWIPGGGGGFPGGGGGFGGGGFGGFGGGGFGGGGAGGSW